jgi:hypothetical protein
MKNIVKGKEYKVKDGDSLDSIAKANGITVKELAKFNFNTDDSSKFNDCLRDKLGSRKKSKDGKNYILSSHDDPGILYIPQNLPKTSYPPNKVHTIKVKVPVPKQFKTSFCVVKFRPKAGWWGEDYGFDWFREADFAFGGKLGDLNYGDKVVGKLYVPVGKPPAQQTMQKDSNSTVGDVHYDPPLLDKLKTEYHVDHLSHTGNKPVDAFTSYITIYNNDTDVKLPRTVEVQAFVTVADEKLEELSLEVKNADGSDNHHGADFIAVSCKESLMGIAIGDAKKMTLKIELKKPMDKDLCILVRAHTRRTDGSELVTSVGKLMVMANDKKHRGHVNLLLVKIITPAFATPGSPASGNLTNQENLFTKLLRQGMINPRVQKPEIVLDLSKDKDFVNNYTVKNGAKRYILAYDWKSGVGNQQLVNRFDVIEDFLDARLKKQLAEKKSTINPDEYIRAYYFGVAGGARVDGNTIMLNGYANSSGSGGIAVMFNTMNEGTSPHEFLHTLGLPHTFDNGLGGGVSAHVKHTYHPTKTENIMDYTHHRTDADYSKMRVTTWHWQWAVMFGSKPKKDD